MDTTSKPTVGIVGASGTLGTALLKEISPLAERGAIKLVILHRPDSDIVVPSFAEARILDVGNSDDSEVKAGTQDLDLLINTTTSTTPEEASTRFHTQLAAGSNLKVYVPADYTLNYAPSAKEAPNAILESLIRRIDDARSLGLPVTSIHNGVFEHTLFDAQATGLDVNGSMLTLYPGAEDNRLPVTSLGYLAKAIRQIVLKEPVGGGPVTIPDVAGKRFYVVEYTASGNEIGAAFVRVSGVKLKYATLTDEECDAISANADKDPMAAINVGIRKAWGLTGFPTGNTTLFEPRGVTSRSLLQTVRDAMRPAG